MKKIVLEYNDFISSGSNRKIYLHESFKNKCLKIAFKENRKFKHWYKQIRPFWLSNENIKEIKAYKILQHKNSEIFQYIPQYYGTIKTTLGTAMIIDYIDNSMKLVDYLKQYGLTEVLQNKIIDMFTILYKNNVQTRDPHLNNHLVKVIDENSIELKIIDGIGNSQLFPIATYIDSVGKKQIKRRMKKFFYYIVDDFPEYKEKTDNIYNLLMEKLN